MTLDRIHDEEFDTSESVVRVLIEEQCPQYVDMALRPLALTGTSNAMWRLGDELVVRLPRTLGAADSVAFETDLLPAVEASGVAEPVAVPTVCHVGRPCDAFGQPWLLLDWLPGGDAWSTRDEPGANSVAFAQDVAALVGRLSSVQELRAPERGDGERGGPLRPLLAALDGWLDDPAWSAGDLVNVAAIRRCADECREASDAVERVFVHGDLIPGNLLTTDGRLSAIIDWGGAGYGDPAQDLAPAWSVFDGRARDAFVEAMGADDETWLRARAFELEHAVGGILYYAPRGHPLADVMRRTLDRLLA